MWFATNGGAYVYDGKSLTNISEKDGLCHNSLNDILEDKEGNFWFATHHNGVCHLARRMELKARKHGNCI
jgi:ligand-binding sensor domain-containing protein